MTINKPVNLLELAYFNAIEEGKKDIDQYLVDGPLREPEKVRRILSSIDDNGNYVIDNVKGKVFGIYFAWVVGGVVDLKLSPKEFIDEGRPISFDRKVTFEPIIGRGLESLR